MYIVNFITVKYYEIMEFNKIGNIHDILCFETAKFRMGGGIITIITVLSGV